MRSLSAAELLAVWERGQGQPPVRKALLLLEAAAPDEPPEALAALPVGQRDARLLRLRAWTLGARLDSLAACPRCGEPLEFAFEADDLLAMPAAEPPATLSLRSDGYEVAFRLPNSLDLAHAGDGGERALLERCLVQVRRRGQDVPAARLPDDVAAAVIDAMAEADPQAEVRLALSCPACGHAWQSTFDIVSYFWKEIEAWAERLLYDVHRLAAAYGWTEADILAMSAWRRQRYLNLIGG